MLLTSLTPIEDAVRASWSVETCDPVDLPWAALNPARGQCGVTAAVVQDLLGGVLLVGDVLHADGSRQGAHSWNLLPGGLQVDLTREQFVDGELIQSPVEVFRPPGLPRRLPQQYQLLRARVEARLGITLPLVEAVPQP